jgi:hypothetical protein
LLFNRLPKLNLLFERLSTRDLGKTLVIEIPCDAPFSDAATTNSNNGFEFEKYFGCDFLTNLGSVRASARAGLCMWKQPEADAISMRRWARGLAWTALTFA